MNANVTSILGAALYVTLAVAQAQERHVLTLEESIDLALHKGFSAADVTARYLSSKKSAESSQRQLWTSVSLSLNAPNFNDALTQQFNPLTGRYEYYQLRTTNVQSTLSITQPIIATGGTLSFNQVLLGRDQTNGLTGAATQFRDYFGSFFVEFRQPLFTPNTQRVNETMAILAEDQAETDFRKNQLDLVYSVTQSFYTVYQLSRQMDIVREQVNQNQESYETARNKYSAGLIPEVEVLQSEVDLASSRNDLLTTEQQLERAKNAFRLLVGIPTADSVDVQGNIAYHPVTVDSAKAVESALRNRSEVLTAQRSVQLRQADVDLAKSRDDFRFDLVAQYGVNRDDTLFSNIFHDFNRTRSASLTVSVPVFDWGSHSLSVEAAEVQYENSQANEDYVLQQVRQEILDLLNSIRLAESRIHVLEKTVEVAQKGYDISLQRFRNGTINRNDLAQAQTRLTLAKTNTLAALIDYELGLADLKRKTLWDFETNQPVGTIINVKE